MKLYQVHALLEIGGQVLRAYDYILANSPTEAKVKAYLNKDGFGEVEIYALEVSKETLKGEIVHCKETIAYWNTKSEAIKKREKVPIIKKRQLNIIKHYEKMLKEMA